MVNTICLAVAYFMFQNGGAEVAAGVAVGLAGVAGIVLLLHPKSTAALWGPEGS